MRKFSNNFFPKVCMFRRSKIKPLTDILVTDREILHFILRTEKYRNFLLEQTKKNFTNENVEFLIDVNMIYKMKSKIEIQQQIQKIYVKFIEPKILNLQSTEFNNINTNLNKGFNMNIYTKAFNNIFLLVINNDIPKLKKEPIFAIIIKDILNNRQKKQKWGLLKSFVFLAKGNFSEKKYSRINLSIIQEEID